jgi:peptidoglycan/LPS O-acetylase OafA/YrhL
MARHAHLPYAAGGFLGVEAFFALSGFLITSLLLAEFERFGSISLRRFYLRRFLRLYPALVLLLLVGGAATLLIPALPRANLTSVPFILLYVANWLQLLSRSPFPLGYYANTWTLAVEEQFYLVWPAIGIACLAWRRGTRPLLLVALAIATFSLVARATAVATPDGAGAYGTDGVAFELMFGCMTALLLRTSPRDGAIARAATWLAWPAVGVMAAVILLDAKVVGSSHPRFDPGQAAGHAVFTLAACVAIAHLYRSPGAVMARIASLWPLVWIGRISYGLYLWHYPLFLFVQKNVPIHSLKLQVGTEVGLTFAVAIGSYFLLERPLLRLKRRFGTIPASDDSRWSNPESGLVAHAGL